MQLGPGCTALFFLAEQFVSVVLADGGHGAIAEGVEQG